jgi:hypothetical protein
MDEAGRIELQQAAQAPVQQSGLFETVEAECVEGGPEAGSRRMCSSVWGVWLGYELLQRLELIPFLAEQLAIGREDIPWATMSMVLVLARWCDPSSELHLAMSCGKSFPNTDPIPIHTNMPRIANSTHRDTDNFSRSVFKVWPKEMVAFSSVDEGACLR